MRFFLKEVFMVCYHPIDCILPLVADSEGKRKLIFSKAFTVENKYLFDDSPLVRLRTDYSDLQGVKIKVPCGQCIGCRLDYSRQWAIRSLHEVNTYGLDNNMFITLTYNNEHLPENGSLSMDDIQKFMKRLRYYAGSDVRYMLCGEYGDKYKRPHYHLCIYNYVFPDINWSRPYAFNKEKGVTYYKSKFLEENLWTEPYTNKSLGFSTIGKVTFESAAYVARYITKKVKNCDHEYLDQIYHGKLREFMTMSRRPGLGNDFVHRYYKDIFNTGYVIFGQGYKAPIPRYYVNELMKIDQDFYNRYKVDKFRNFLDNIFSPEFYETYERLNKLEELKISQGDRLLRSYEFEGSLHNIY